MNRFLLPIVVFGVLVAVFSIGLLKDPSKIPSPLVGRQVPEFSLPELSKPDTTIAHTDLLGKYSLVNVWASWCFACRQEHDFLLQLARSGTISVYGLNWRDDRVRALSWLSDLGDPYTATAFDFDGRVGINFGVYGAPETFLIGPSGEILHKHISPLTQAIWDADFAPLIDEGTGS